jgi:probable phosphoglycerate mutase
VYLAGLLGLARPLSFNLDYTGITRINLYRDGRREVRTINEIAHVADILDPLAATPVATTAGKQASRPVPAP